MGRERQERTNEKRRRKNKKGEGQSDKLWQNTLRRRIPLEKQSFSGMEA